MNVTTSGSHYIVHPVFTHDPILELDFLLYSKISKYYWESPALAKALAFCTTRHADIRSFPPVTDELRVVVFPSLFTVPCYGHNSIGVSFCFLSHLQNVQRRDELECWASGIPSLDRAGLASSFAPSLLNLQIHRYLILQILIRLQHSTDE